MAHMVRVLIDHEAVLSGAARDGAPWKFYDLGHSYCTNAFWSTCPHRMACVGCSFNLPKTSAKAMAVEAMTSVTRLLEEVPLSPDEWAAAEGDMTAWKGCLPSFGTLPRWMEGHPRRYTLQRIVRLDDRHRKAVLWRRRLGGQGWPGPERPLWSVQRRQADVHSENLSTAGDDKAVFLELGRGSGGAGTQSWSASTWPLTAAACSAPVSSSGVIFLRLIVTLLIVPVNLLSPFL
jgi:hypothetical protein